MKSIKKAVLYGFLLWLIIFLISIFTFPVRETNRPLFESIMPVAISICVVLFSLRYFARVDRRFLLEGILIGLIWLVINVAIDIPLFLVGGPMKTTPFEYASDIGITYLMIPIITIGLGRIAGRKVRRDQGGTAATGPAEEIPANPSPAGPQTAAGDGTTENPPSSSTVTT
jgi:hypothetical protein